MSDAIGRPLKSSPSLRSRSRTLRLGLIRLAAIAVVIAILAIVVAAWLDGGEEPIRPIVQQVVLPTTELES